MTKRVGVFLAIVALVAAASFVGRQTAVAGAAVFMCDGAQINSGGCIFPSQDTPDLRTLNFDNRASSVLANSGPVALYADSRYRGRCQTIPPDTVVALTGSWVGDNTVSSVRMGPCLASDWTGPQKLWPGNPGATGAGDFVGDVKVIAGSSSSVSCGSGWTKTNFIGSGDPADLNRGAGGAFVYLCVRYTNRPTFVALYAVAGDATDVPCQHPSHFKVPGDLNKGAGGKFIYFCVADDSGYWLTGSHIGNWIYFVRVGSTGIAHHQALNTARQDCDDNWTYQLSIVDLNEGAGGDYIFTCVRYSGSA